MTSDFSAYTGTQPFFFAQRRRSATNRAGAGRASARPVTARFVGCSALLAFCDEAIILLVIADPKPHEVFTIGDSQRTNPVIHAGGPKLADLLEMQRRM